jgi:hypothetical protein
MNNIKYVGMDVHKSITVIVVDARLKGRAPLGISIPE